MLRSTCALGIALLLAACGGGGGGASPDPATAAPISGYVVKGPTSGATVQLHALDASGRRTLLAQATSGPDGAYSFNVDPGAGTTLLVSAQGGSYVDEATSQTRTLNTALRAFAVRGSGPQRVSPNPYSELAVRSVEAAASPWTAASIQAANSAAALWLGVAQVLDFRPVQLQQPNLDPTAISADDLAMSLSAGAFSMFAHRLDADPSSSLSGALASLHHLVEVDPADDRLFPAFVGGLVDFVDRMGLTDQEKLNLKSALLAGDYTLGAANLSRIVPRGTSSGNATAPMPDDGFRLLGSPGGRTVFNRRGALIGFTSSAAVPDWQILYTASVGELFGDGEVGIGRWNGGATISWLPEPTLTHLLYDAMHYAVATQPLDVPVCGLRRLTLTANTKPTLLSESIGEQQAFVDLTPDSQVSLQYFGGIYLGADIGVRLADNSIVRFRTLGGVEAPWASGRPITDGPVSLLAVEPAGPLEGRSMAVTALAAGTGARKVAAQIDVNLSSMDPTRSTAVFIAAAGAPEAHGCTSVGSPGPGITPRPTDGDHNVFLSFNGESTFRGAPGPATFGSAGELQSVSPFALSAPVYELAGNADASIGRVVVTGQIAGSSVSRSTPYAVTRPGAALPATGTVHYDLVNTTSVMTDLGGSGSEVPPGTVATASLSITYGEYPLGTPSPWYGTASLRVDGQIGGIPFSVGDPGGSAPAQARMVGEAFNENNIQGAVAAPDGEWAAVHYKAGARIGTLLFRRRP